jgi:hypothetical protein
MGLGRVETWSGYFLVDPMIKVVIFSHTLGDSRVERGLISSIAFCHSGPFFLRVDALFETNVFGHRAGSLVLLEHQQSTTRTTHTTSTTGRESTFEWLYHRLVEYRKKSLVLFVLYFVYVEWGSSPWEEFPTFSSF